MYPNTLEIQQGTKILWEGTIREVAFKINYVLGVDDDWHDAEIRGNAITEQMVQDWLEEMSAQGRIQYIDPITFIQNFEAGMIPAFSDEITRGSRHKKYISGIVSAQFQDIRDLGDEAPPQISKPPAQDCLIHKAVQLIFDGTASQERAVRILRAYEEPYTFVHQENGNWTCLHKDKSYQLYVDMQKHIGYCSCQDFQQRGMQSGMPCKHIYGYVLQGNPLPAGKALAENGRR